MLIFALAAALSATHPGGLNAEGCHNDRKNGGYHCHRGNATRSPPPAPPSSQRLQGPSGGTRSEGAFANCAAARAAGAAPVRRGDPGYSPRLDRDGDGVGCER